MNALEWGGVLLIITLCTGLIWLLAENIGGDWW